VAKEAADTGLTLFENQQSSTSNKAGLAHCGEENNADRNNIFNKNRELVPANAGFASWQVGGSMASSLVAPLVGDDAG